MLCTRFLHDFLARRDTVVADGERMRILHWFLVMLASGAQDNDNVETSAVEGEQGVKSDSWSQSNQTA